MNSKTRHFLLLHFISIFFTAFVSFYFGGLYIEGDQYYYNLWFNELRRLSFIDGYLYYSSQVNFIEVIHFVTSWVGGLVFEKIVLYSIVNIIFMWLLIEVFRKLDFNPLIAFLVLFTNFYVPVLLLAAERLKFGFIFFFLFYIYIQYRRRAILFVFTLLGHLQFLILWLSIACGLFLKNI